jgi:hypothetical protein
MLWNNGTWNKLMVYEGTIPITAVHIDWILNAKDFPHASIGYFGTSDGWLAKNIPVFTNSERIYYESLMGYEAGQLPVNFGVWTNLHLFDSPIERITTSDMDSTKLVVGAGTSVYTSLDGGISWVTFDGVESFLGVCVRGDEIQALFSNGVMHRSPNFGKDWYQCYGLPPTAKDVSFSTKNIKDSMVISDGTIYKYSSGDGSFTYETSTSISGSAVRVRSSPYTETAIITTSNRVYLTSDWGKTLTQLRNTGATDVALGGSALYTGA